jgi:hypothetical protein
MLPVLGREVVEYQQYVAVFGRHWAALAYFNS